MGCDEFNRIVGFKSSRDTDHQWESRQRASVGGPVAWQCSGLPTGAPPPADSRACAGGAPVVCGSIPAGWAGQRRQWPGWMPWRANSESVAATSYPASNTPHLRPIHHPGCTRSRPVTPASGSSQPVAAAKSERAARSLHRCWFPTRTRRGRRVVSPRVPSPGPDPSPRTCAGGR